MAHVERSGPVTEERIYQAGQLLAEREAELAEAAATAVCLIESFETATNRALVEITQMRHVLSERPVSVDIARLHKEREEAIHARSDEQTRRAEDNGMMLRYVQMAERERDRARMAVKRFEWAGPGGTCLACHRERPEHSSDCEIKANLPNAQGFSRPRR